MVLVGEVTDSQGFVDLDGLLQCRATLSAGARPLLHPSTMCACGARPSLTEVLLLAVQLPLHEIMNSLAYH